MEVIWVKLVKSLSVSSSSAVKYTYLTNVQNLLYGLNNDKNNN